MIGGRGEVCPLPNSHDNDNTSTIHALNSSLFHSAFSESNSRAYIAKQAFLDAVCATKIIASDGKNKTSSRQLDLLVESSQPTSVPLWVPYNHEFQLNDVANKALMQVLCSNTVAMELMIMDTKELGDVHRDVFNILYKKDRALRLVGKRMGFHCKNPTWLRHPVIFCMY